MYAKSHLTHLDCHYSICNFVVQQDTGFARCTVTCVINKYMFTTHPALALNYSNMPTVIIYVTGQEQKVNFSCPHFTTFNLTLIQYLRSLLLLDTSAYPSFVHSQLDGSKSWGYN